MIHVMKKYQHYMLGNNFKFVIDYDTLTYMLNQPIVSGKLAKMIMLLMEYNFGIDYGC